jgi:hypothetical protein
MEANIYKPDTSNFQNGRVEIHVPISMGLTPHSFTAIKKSHFKKYDKQFQQYKQNEQHTPIHRTQTNHQVLALNRHTHCAGFLWHLPTNGSKHLQAGYIKFSEWKG